MSPADTQVGDDLSAQPASRCSAAHRPADNWRVLLSIADSLGHSEDARAAAVALSKDRPDEDAGVVLLADILTVFDKLGDDRIRSEDLVKELLALNDFWNDWDDKGRKLTATHLSRLLRNFHIRSKVIWPANRSANSKSYRGYLRSQFETAWASYCGEGVTPSQSKKTIRLVKG